MSVRRTVIRTSDDEDDDFVVPAVPSVSVSASSLTSPIDNQSAVSKLGTASSGSSIVTTTETEPRRSSRSGSSRSQSLNRSKGTQNVFANFVTQLNSSLNYTAFSSITA
jgi:hypothetical protein